MSKKWRSQRYVHGERVGISHGSKRMLREIQLDAAYEEAKQRAAELALRDELAIERIASNLSNALRANHRPWLWHAEIEAKTINSPDVRARAQQLCAAARAAVFGPDPDYFSEQRKQLELTFLNREPAPETKAKAAPSTADERLPLVEEATLKVAGLFARAKWDGGPWKDGGRAMVRGTTITLAYQEWASAYGMTVPPIVDGYPELADMLEEARAALRSLPLAELAPEYFGHVHETLTDWVVERGELVRSGGAKRGKTTKGERRKYGAHFTPQSLARPVARRTIKPLLRVLAEAGTKDLGQRVLTLKICDPAVGAGAFLLSVVRLLAGVVRHSGPAETIEEAKRLLAIHVVHGVDKDAYGVLATKYALTLECRADRMPRTWLDHAIKHGDALVGLDQQQIKAFHWKKDQAAMSGIDALYGRAIDQAARSAIAHREQLAAQARYA